jgi:hypothetical protein
MTHAGLNISPAQLGTRRLRSSAGAMLVADVSQESLAMRWYAVPITR